MKKILPLTMIFFVFLGFSSSKLKLYVYVSVYLCVCVSTYVHTEVRANVWASVLPCEGWGSTQAVRSSGLVTSSIAH